MSSEKSQEAGQQLNEKNSNHSSCGVQDAYGAQKDKSMMDQTFQQLGDSKNIHVQEDEI